MRMTPHHYTLLATYVKRADTAKLRRRYADGSLSRADQVYDLNRRYRWDLFWTVSRELREELREYNDSHIDTALRRMVPPLAGEER